MDPTDLLTTVVVRDGWANLSCACVVVPRLATYTYAGPPLVVFGSLKEELKKPTVFVTTL
ncbi:MAG: hypothetical protein NVS2B12_08910 [Ktedonobacteraceae bacterium]